MAALGHLSITLDFLFPAHVASLPSMSEGILLTHEGMGGRTLAIRRRLGSFSSIEPSFRSPKYAPGGSDAGTGVPSGL